ncbi:hypothetical protein GDO81_001857 [Engystomops pustulosus]|uniref:Ig-like domain-containing protein n=1 Tax=Engystomops pustulosus TaxID=76066 RepID=A0AAV7DHZ3_ENGPU|nr:hypothetical protein GDO81_001857 [Engystomops pustulosus]
MDLKFCKILTSTLIFLFLLTYVQCNVMPQIYTEKIIREGDTTVFNCSYTSTKYVLIWYVQKSGGSIIFLLHDQSKKEDLDKEYKERITASHFSESKTFPLTIRNIQRSDAGIYYCALEHGTM